MNRQILAACSAMALTASAHASLQITNGDFQNNAPASNVTDVDSWFDPHTDTAGQWWRATWYGPTVSPNGTSVMGLSWMLQGTQNWAYQGIGVNDGGLSTLTLQFDVGSFTDANGARDMGITLSLFQSASFVGADNTDIEGAGGVTLIDTVNVTSGSLTPGTFVTKQVTLNLGSANGTDPLFLRFENYSTGTGDPWAAIDNVQIVPEPTAFALVGLAGALGLIYRRRK
jgi:hypothetical protein